MQVIKAEIVIERLEGSKIRAKERKKERQIGRERGGYSREREGEGGKGWRFQVYGAGAFRPRSVEHGQA